MLFFFLTGFTQKENQYSYRNTTGLTKPEEKTAQEEGQTALEAAFSGEFGHRTTGPKRFSVSWARRMGGRRQRNQHFIHQDEFSPGKPGQPLSPSTLCQHHSQTLLPSVRATRITRVFRSPQAHPLSGASFLHLHETKTKPYPGVQRRGACTRGET